MWVWKKLGFDNVFELPSSALEVIGRRCRTADSLPKDDGGQLQEVLVDMDGLPVEFCQAGMSSKSRGSSHEFRGTPQPWQLVTAGPPLRPRSASSGASPGGGSATNKRERGFGLAQEAKLCMPGSIELVQEPDADLIDSLGNISKLKSVGIWGAGKGDVSDQTVQEQLSAAARVRDQTVQEVKQLIEKYVSHGQGTFTWRIPKAFARLTEMALSECCGTSGPNGWPLSVVGTVIGAELQVTVCPPAPGAPKPKAFGWQQTPPEYDPTSEMPPVGDGSIENAQLAKNALVQEHVIECDGFRLHIMQRGGPAIDPAKLCGMTEEAVAKELERWANKLLTKRPGTWRTLVVNTRQSTTGPENILPRSNVLEQPCHGWRGGDVVLAATVVTELVLEPFELSYGDEHIKQVRRMLEDEVAAVLKIDSSQVLCGDLQSKGKGSRQRHVRRETVGLRFAILHEDLAAARQDAAKEPFGALAPPGARARVSTAPKSMSRSMLPPIIGDISEHATILSKNHVLALAEAEITVQDTNANSMTVALKQTMAAALARSELEKVDHNLRKARGAKKSKFGGSVLTQAEDSMLSLTSAEAIEKMSLDKTSLRKTASAPDFSTTSSTIAMQQSSQSFRPSSSESLQNKQPDNLVKIFQKRLDHPKHPLQKRLDCFPVLARIPKGKTVIGSTLVAQQEQLKLEGVAGAFKENIKNLVRPKRKLEKDIDHVDTEASVALRELRERTLEKGALPDGDLALRREKIQQLSPKGLLDWMESCSNLYVELTAVLDVQIEQTEDGEDACVKLRSHGATKKMTMIIIQFKSDRSIIEKCIRIYSNFTKHDPGAVDRLYEEDTAPLILDALKCFPAARVLQVHGCKLLRRLYDLARHKATQGRRFVVIGKTLPECWTFQGIDHVIATMAHFRADVDIQLDCFNMLVPLADILDALRRQKVFDLIEKAMRDHAGEHDLVAHGIHAIARLGPTFMAHEHRGVRAIVEAMARHRSCVKLQRVANKALFTLCSQEDSLKRCRQDGAVSAIAYAMTAHCRDQQVLQMGVRCLEKHCPRGLWKLSHICGDLVSVLPIVLYPWRTDPLDHNPACFSLAELRAEYDFKDELLDSFHSEVMAFTDGGRPPSPPSPNEKGETAEDRNNLATVAGYRRVGLRDEIDASDVLWAVPGPQDMHPPIRVAHNVLARDVKALKKHPIYPVDIEPHLIAGPRRGHIKLLCEALREGLPGQKPTVVPPPAATKGQVASAPTPAAKPVRFGPEDAELFACILGHFAWHKEENANTVVSSGGVSTLLKWLRCEAFTGLNPSESNVVYPMQRACLAALACVCRHGQDCASALLSAEGAENKANSEPSAVSMIIDLAQKEDDVGMRRCALRVLARLMPHAINRSGGERLQPWSKGMDIHGYPSAEQVWPMILKMLGDDDEAIRGAAAACSLEAALAGWAALERFEEHELGERHLESFIEALVNALQRSVEGGAAACALPLLLTISQLSEDDAAIKCLCDNDVGLLPLITTWPPRAAEAAATGIDRAAAAAACKALKCLSEQGVIQMSVGDLQKLLMCASSDHTIHAPTLREALEAALHQGIQREEDVSILATLAGTPIQAANGRVRLANVDVLTAIAQRLAEKSPGKNAGAASETLVGSLEYLKPLVKAEAKGGHLQELLTNLRSACGLPEEPLSPDTSPTGDGSNKLPPISRSTTASVR
jgi:hypothetical protein